MPYVRVTDMPATWADYTAPSERGADTPDGLIVFAAGPTSEGIRTVEVWVSEADWARGQWPADKIPGNSSIREMDARVVVVGREALGREARR